MESQNTSVASSQGRYKPMGLLLATWVDRQWLQGIAVEAELCSYAFAAWDVVASPSVLA